MLLRCKCLQKMLLHHASQLWRRKRADTPHISTHGDYNISKYLEVAKRLGIGITSLGFGMYELRKGDVTRRLMGSLVDREKVITYKLCGNKYLTYKVLLNNGIRCVPRHQLYAFSDVEKTCRDFVDWQCPVVIKPCSGTSCGNGVTVNIRTIKELKNAICESFIFDRRAYLMEQFIEGSHFRVVTLKGEFVACTQRTPARIVGNGKDSIRTLVQKENQRRSRDQSEYALYPIPVDNEIRRKLRSMHKSMDSVLEADEELHVRDSVNLHAGGELIRMGHISEDIKRTCEDAAKILDIYLAGFDIITCDISKPLEEANGVINEVNTSPGMDVMYKVPQHGEPVHVVELVLCDMFNLGEVPCGAHADRSPIQYVRSENMQ